MNGILFINIHYRLTNLSDSEKDKKGVRPVAETIVFDIPPAR